MITHDLPRPGLSGLGQLRPDRPDSDLPRPEASARPPSSRGAPEPGLNPRQSSPQVPPQAGPIGVIGLGSYLPATVRDNRTVGSPAGVSAQWIAERTGVRQRHVAAPGEAASDLAAGAVRAACTAAGLLPEQLGLLVLATSTPDELGPATACRVQAAIGASRAVALDVSAACSGWLFAARVAHDWLRASPEAGYAAVVGVEAYSKFVDPTDRATAVLFADGAAATILGPVPEGTGFAEFHLGSDGGGAHHVLIPSGGSRRPASPASTADGGHHIHMDGRAVRDFISEVFPRLVAESLARHRLTVADIDAFITHQPNPVLLRSLGERIGIPGPRLHITGDRVGNIGAASTPFALTDAAARGLLPAKGRVLLCVFGAGLTWGSSLLTWSGAPACQVVGAA
ncbi:3-oxoacyl-ACP synthase [Kitasatospora sp. MMS16-BH015]|uniref:3-oxoacyl-ACP synthase III family protein n=1 Tax=Kitasatospora sp. MMS16-BH015 TaxID=2018025 RepID=UPI000CA2C7EE|nr:ketoacyl-ACP synthase III [Kitasatospora sp. MMS16-BH015]AUG75082.1 3-oxoacyl-ACP synthase [Kitasatospora sp. MMS16-BH015]